MHKIALVITCRILSDLRIEKLGERSKIVPISHEIGHSLDLTARSVGF